MWDGEAGKIVSTHSSSCVEQSSLTPAISRLAELRAQLADFLLRSTSFINESMSYVPGISSGDLMPCGIQVRAHTSIAAYDERLDQHVTPLEGPHQPSRPTVSYPQADRDSSGQLPAASPAARDRHSSWLSGCSTPTATGGRGKAGLRSEPLSGAAAGEGLGVMAVSSGVVLLYVHLF